ncbi:tyrosine protein kinase [Nocardia sp. NPDC059239]|uniref:tyrosine protein kinase n=1 Tax=unclassified Nocardia TaxID=2637762 RepID=UPI0036CB90A0
MSVEIHSPATDLLRPLPAEGEQWDPHTIHTYYFGFSVPEAAIGAFVYLRLQPAFSLSQGGVCLFQGMDNIEFTDMAFLDYEITMPWPVIANNTITTDNGLVIEFLEPGHRIRTSYQSDDASFDIVAEAVTPLLARGHVMPGEEDHHSVGRSPGGSEQFMHVTGELTLGGERYPVDCFAPRDRSWNQVRVEKRGAVPVPPVGWSPMYFGPDLIFNQISFEPLDTDPAWAGLYYVGDRPSHHYAWIRLGEETRSITRVRRSVLEYHPDLYMAVRQEIEAEDEHGTIHRFRGEAIAAANIPAWPNAAFRDSVFRWEDEHGRVTYATYQEIWFDRYQQAMKRRAVAGHR